MVLAMRLVLIFRIFLKDAVGVPVQSSDIPKKTRKMQRKQIVRWTETVQSLVGYYIQANLIFVKLKRIGNLLKVNRRAVAIGRLLLPLRFIFEILAVQSIALHSVLKLAACEP